MKDKFYISIMKVCAGSAGSQVAWVVAIMVISRLYTVEDLGAQQLFISGASILAAVASGRYELAITLPRYRFQAINLLIFTILLTIMITLLLLIAIVILYEKVMSITGLDGLNLLLLPLYILEICWYFIAYAWLIREKKYLIASKGLILFPLIYLVFSVVLKNMNMLISTLILSLLVARGAELIYYGYHIFRDTHYMIIRLSLKSVLASGKEYIDFPKYLLFGAFADAATWHVIPFFISNFWGTLAIGYYSLANQCLAAPAALVGKSIGDVFRQEGSCLYAKYRACYDFYRKNLRICCIYACIISAIIIILSPTVISYLFGCQWEKTVDYIQVMLPMAAVGLIASPLSNMYIVARQQKRYLSIQVLGLVSSVIGMGIGGYNGLSIEMALLSWGGLSIIVNFISIYGGLKISRGR